MRASRMILATTFLFALACGARTDLPEGEEADGSVAQDASQDVWDSTIQDSAPDVQPDVADVSVQDVSIDVGVDAGPECIADCTHNFECEQTCPTLQTGRWCCDEQVGTCYAFSGKHCPQQIFDAGFD